MNLFDNPFYILGASLQDNRKRILELAQEKMLSLDSDIVSEARLMLTTPSRRINAEIAWLPGMSKEGCETNIQYLTGIKYVIQKKWTLNIEKDFSLFSIIQPPLVSINMMISIFAFWQDMPESSLIDLVYTFAVRYDEIDVDNVLETLNQDRAVAKMPEIQGSDIVEQSLETHKNYCIDKIWQHIDRMSPKKITAAMLFLVETSVKRNKQLSIIDTLVDKNYAIKVQPYLHNQENRIKNSAKNLEADIADNSNSRILGEKVDLFIKELSDFDEVMQPIQLSMQQRGLEHKESKEVAYIARNIAIDLLNKANNEKLSEKLMIKVKELFTEISSVDERVDKDLATLEEIKEENREIEEKMTCSISGSWGYKLSISPKGIDYAGSHYELNDIKTIQYGATKEYVNGIKTGIKTLVYFSTGEKIAKITWLKYDDWKKFVDCLGNALLPKIIYDMACELTLGSNLYGIIYDDKVKLAKEPLFLPIEEKFFPWSEVSVYSASGYFIIESKKDKDWQLPLSYQDDPNTHAIELLIRTAFRKGAVHISSAFNISKNMNINKTKYYNSPQKDLSSYRFIGRIFYAIFFLGIFIFYFLIKTGRY